MQCQSSVLRKANRAASKLAAAPSILPQKSRSPAKGSPTFNLIFGEGSDSKRLANIVSDAGATPSSFTAPSTPRRPLTSDDMDDCSDATPVRGRVQAFFEWAQDQPEFADHADRALLDACQAFFEAEDYSLSSIFDMTAAMYKDERSKKGMQLRMKKALAQYQKESVRSVAADYVAPGRGEKAGS